MRWVLALVAATGCYGPSPSPGAPCGPDGACPSGLVCTSDVCVLPGLVRDGAPDTPPGDGPPRPDGPLPDGPIANLSGCSDGEREGFPQVDAFPAIAGCAASWAGPHDMREAPVGAACGDDLGDCPRPADACATGWSVCGLEGLPEQLAARATDAECAAAGGAPGAFASAMSHCTSFVSTCDYATPYPCLTAGDCSEAVCCGPDCRSDLGCLDGVYPGQTHAGGTVEGGCGALLATTFTGVLCCKD